MIEAKNIEASLERIAAALETIAAGGGALPVLHDDPPAEESAKPDKKKSAASKTVGKVADEHGITKDEVRAKLQAVQQKATPAKAKSILKQEGASTIGNLAVSKYPLIIAACDKVLEE